MRWIQHLDLKNKLVLLAAVSGAMALLMACAGFVWHDLRLIRAAQIEELRSHAELLATSFILQDESDATELLRSLVREHGTIDGASLFDRSGRSVASFSRVGSRQGGQSVPSDHYSHRYTEFGELELFHPIIEHGTEIGVVYLKANMREFYQQVRSHAILIVTVTLCSLAVALLFGSMMQSLISRPILQLADAARKITTDDDYTIRVSTDSHDEIGVLYGSFNRMLEKIQTSQAELKLARDEMEDRVEQRTRELQDEIQQRERIQQELVRAKEAAGAASEAKSRFLANMSHEIRTPLNGILGFADYMLIHDSALRMVDRRDYLQTIKNSGMGLLALINDILDLSKIEAGQMEFEKVPLSPDAVISDVISILLPKACEKCLSLDYRWSGELPTSIESDPLRFRQVLMNLIGNAVKFSETGSVHVVARVDRLSRKLAVDVIDTGVGIPLEIQTSLFKPFIQGDSSVTRRFGGTGLGLSICKSIVAGLGGEIRVASEPGKGSTFSFTIDAGAVDQKPLTPYPTNDPATSIESFFANKALRSRRILVADDGETNRKLIQLILLRAGAETVLVENGKDAVAAADIYDFDLILLDMQMPVMDGYTAALRLRANGFVRPIVALTADAMQGDEDRCIQAGCSDYLTKPIRQELLLARINALLTETEVPTACEPSQHVEEAENNGLLVSDLPIEDPAFAELVSEFIERAREKLAELSAAQWAGDHEKLAKLAHWMKGSGGMAGFPAITEVARSLEHSIRAGKTTEAMSGIANLTAVIQRLQAPSLQTT